MPTDNGTELNAHVAHLSKDAASGIKHILDFAEHMKTVTENLPDDLKPFGQALADSTMQALIESYAACLTILSELRLQQIARTANPPKHHTEPDGITEKGSYDA